MENNSKKKSNVILVIVFVILSIATLLKIYNKYLNRPETVFSAQTINREFEFELDDKFNDLQLKTLNGKVKLEGYGGNSILLKVSYIPKEEGYEVDFYRDNVKNFILDYDDSKFKSVSIDAQIPQDLFKTIEISSINSSSNIENLYFNKLILNGINNNINLEKVNGKELTVQNMNGEILLKDSDLKEAKLNNMNGAIKLDSFDIRNIKISNINSVVSISTDGMLTDFDNYNWEVENQNGKIGLELAEPNNLKYVINAETTNGNITVNKDNLEYSTNTPKKVIAKTYNPEKLNKSLNLSLKTTNSSIVLN